MNQRWSSPLISINMRSSTSHRWSSMISENFPNAYAADRSVRNLSRNGTRLSGCLFQPKINFWCTRSTSRSTSNFKKIGEGQILAISRDNDMVRNSHCFQNLIKVTQYGLRFLVLFQAVTLQSLKMIVCCFGGTQDMQCHSWVHSSYNYTIGCLQMTLSEFRSYLNPFFHRIYVFNWFVLLSFTPHHFSAHKISRYLEMRYTWSDYY